MVLSLSLKSRRTLRMATLLSSEYFFTILTNCCRLSPVSAGIFNRMIFPSLFGVRARAADVSIIGRNTQGVTLINIAKDEELVSVAKIAESDEEEGDSGSEE